MSNIHIPISDITYLDKNRNITVYNSKKEFVYNNTLDSNVIIKQILESKRPVIGEIELTLFEWCPINCSFCNHDKNSIIGKSENEILSKLEIIESFVADRASTVQLIQINFVGGELLADEILDEYLPIYLKFTKKLVDLSSKYDIDIEGVFVSNFLFNEPSQIKIFLDECNLYIKTSLICSYDFDGRPTNSQYYTNIKFLENYISSINLVATNRTINKMMDMKDEYFSDYLYPTFNIYIDDFIPDNNTESYIPSDSLMLKFLKFLYITYPEANPVKELVTNTMNKMHCLSLNKITIFPDNSISNCKWHRYKPSEFDTYKNTEINYVDNAPQMEKFISENECLSCEYFNKCGFRCFTQSDWVNRIRDLDQCLMKLFFDYVK